MSKLKSLCFLALALIGFSAFAQDSQYGSIWSFELEKEVNDWTFSTALEMRTISYFDLIERGSVELAAEYKFNKYLRVGGGYEFRNVVDPDYLNYQLRHKIFGNVEGRYKLDRFQFSLREKFQLTFKDESNRVEDDGDIDEYRVNPIAIWRNRFKVAYNIKGSKLEPAISFETFLRLNDSEQTSWENFRTKLGLGYKIDKKNSIELFGLMNSEQYSEDALGKYFIGVGYKLEL